MKGGFPRPGDGHPMTAGIKGESCIALVEPLHLLQEWHE